MEKIGIFSRLAAGGLNSGVCKRWPSDHSAGGGVLLVLPSCTGHFSTTSVPLTERGPVPADWIEPGKSLTHAQLQERNLTRAKEILRRYSTPTEP